MAFLAPYVIYLFRAYKELGVMKIKTPNIVPPAQRAAQYLECYVCLWLSTYFEPGLWGTSRSIIPLNFPLLTL